MLSRISRASARSTSSPRTSPASQSQRGPATGSASRSTPESPSQVFTKDCTTRSGMGAGFVSSSGTHAGSAMQPS